MSPNRCHFERGIPVSNAPSDGFGTGFVVYVLRQAGVPVNKPEMIRGVNWLLSNQRASGRWFSPSPDANQRPEAGTGTRDLYVMNMGTGFAVMALKACERTEAATPLLSPPAVRLHGLSLRGRVLD